MGYARVEFANESRFVPRRVPIIGRCCHLCCGDAARPGFAYLGGGGSSSRPSRSSNRRASSSISRSCRSRSARCQRSRMLLHLRRLRKARRTDSCWGSSEHKSAGVVAWTNESCRFHLVPGHIRPILILWTSPKELQERAYSSQGVRPTPGSFASSPPWLSQSRVHSLLGVGFDSRALSSLPRTRCY